MGRRCRQGLGMEVEIAQKGDSEVARRPNAEWRAEEKEGRVRYLPSKYQVPEEETQAEMELGVLFGGAALQRSR